MENKNNKGKFIKVGNSISFKFSTDGLDYDLQPGSVYTVSYTGMRKGLLYLKHQV